MLPPTKHPRMLACSHKAFADTRSVLPYQQPSSRGPTRCSWRCTTRKEQAAAAAAGVGEDGEGGGRGSTLSRVRGLVGSAHLLWWRYGSEGTQRPGGKVSDGEGRWCRNDTLGLLLLKTYACAHACIAVCIAGERFRVGAQGWMRYLIFPETCITFLIYPCAMPGGAQGLASPAPGCSPTSLVMRS